MASDVPYPIRSQPGIQRDGTQFAADAYTDGLWCRFQRGKPRKVFGYQSSTNTLPEQVYGLTSYSQGGIQYTHEGSSSFLTQVRLNSFGNFLGLSDRTPAIDFNPSADNLWQFESLSDPSGFVARIIAHPGQNLSDISNDVETDIFVGDVNAGTALITTAMDPQSGGIVVLYPYLLSFGNAGRVDISDAEDLAVPPPETVFVTGSKIIRGMSLRGGGSGPSGLLWSLDSLVRATFNSADPTEPTFAFDTITDEISVLSSRGIIQNDGIYYWAGVDRFQMFNGVVREIPNQMNANFFFDNVNYTQRQKIFAYKVPRFGEIWWCFPRGNATECNHAVVYNWRENFWFDTPLPNSGRSDGIYAKVYNKPFMTGIDRDPTTDLFTLWQHETGVDQINGSSVQPIRSYFETGDVSLINTESPTDQSIRVARVEPDFIQTGDLKLTITGQANARATAYDTVTKTFPDTATTAAEQTVTFKDAVRRILRFRFESNTSGGNYQMGNPLAHIKPNDGRVTQ